MKCSTANIFGIRIFMNYKRDRNRSIQPPCSYVWRQLTPLGKGKGQNLILVLIMLEKAQKTRFGDASDLFQMITKIWWDGVEKFFQAFIKFRVHHESKIWSFSGYFCYFIQSFAQRFLWLKRISMARSLQQVKLCEFCDKLLCSWDAKWF